MRSTIKLSTMGLFLLLALNSSCKDRAQNQTTVSDQNASEAILENNKGQAFIEDGR